MGWVLCAVLGNEGVFFLCVLVRARAGEERERERERERDGGFLLLRKKKKSRLLSLAFFSPSA